MCATEGHTPVAQEQAKSLMASIREITSLPISQSILQLLSTHGFRYVSDLKNVTPFDLASELGIEPTTAAIVLETALGSVHEDGSKSTNNSAQTTAKDLLLKFSTQCRPIITFCKSLDIILGGGIQIGQITEFCGVPGIGKTQLAIQLSLNVQIPEIFSGNAGDAIYIDTEGSFTPERANEMAIELSSHLQKIAKVSQTRKVENFPSQKVAADSMTAERFVSISIICGIEYYS